MMCKPMRLKNTSRSVNENIVKRFGLTILLCFFVTCYFTCVLDHIDYNVSELGSDPSILCPLLESFRT